MSVRPTINEGPYKWLCRGIIGLQQMLSDCAESREWCHVDNLDNLDGAIESLIESRNAIACFSDPSRQWIALEETGICGEDAMQVDLPQHE